MGKSWKGFMAQNELVKLEWAAMEECRVASVAKGFGALFRQEEQDQDPRQKGEPTYILFCERKSTKPK